MAIFLLHEQNNILWDYDITASFFVARLEATSHNFEPDESSSSCHGITKGDMISYVFDEGIDMGDTSDILVKAWNKAYY